MASHFPCDLPVDASLDSHQRTRISSKFNMRRLEKILTQEGKIERAGVSYADVPSQTDVGGAVGPNSLRGKAAGESICFIDLEPFRQVEERLERHLAAGARPQIRTENIPRIGEPCLVPQRHMQIGIGAAHLPPGRD